MRDPSSLAWAARVRGVRELTLVGRADAGYWRERLRPWGVAPEERDGAASLIVMAGALRWKGVAFREVSFSVVLQPPSTGAYPESAALLHAFNTNRLFAFSERVFFSAPYHAAEIDVRCDGPWGFRVDDAGGPVLDASWAGPSGADPIADGPAGQYGPVLLPPAEGRRADRYFIAEVHGRTRAYRFDAARDTVEIGAPRSELPLLAGLRDSGFRGFQWIVRRDAFHGKSKTYRLGTAAAAAA